VSSQPVPVSDAPITFFLPEDERIDALTAENRQLRLKESFLNRLLLGMTLLTRHPSIVSGDLPSALRDITRMAARSVEVQRASIWFLDDSRTTLTCACLFDGTMDLHGEGAKLQAADHPAYFTEIELGRVIVANDAVQDPRTREFAKCYLLPLRISSMLDVPIKLGDKLVGVVCLEHTGDLRTWLHEEQQFAAFISGTVGLALQASGRRGEAL